MLWPIDRAVAQGALQRQHRGGAITSQCRGPILLFDEAFPGDAEGLDGSRRQYRRFRGRDTVQHYERGGQRIVVRNAEINGPRKLQQASQVLALTPKLLANGRHAGRHRRRGCLGDHRPLTRAAAALPTAVEKTAKICDHPPIAPELASLTRLGTVASI